MYLVGRQNAGGFIKVLTLQVAYSFYELRIAVAYAFKRLYHGPYEFPFAIFIDQKTAC